MNLVLKILARLGLVLTLFPSFLFLAGFMNLDTVKWIMIIGSVLWLAAAPLVQKQNEKVAD